MVRGPGVRRTLEWIALDDAGEAIARVVRNLGPVCTAWRSYRAVALDEEAKLIELRPTRRGRCGLAGLRRRPGVGRAALPMQAVRRAEAALGSGGD